MNGLSSLSRSVRGVPVLITGAASGMGRATANLFADQGATVAVTDINTSGVDRVVADITAAGGTATGWRLDVSDDDGVTRVVDEVAATFGGLAILVNNAGIATFAAIGDPDYMETWVPAIEVLLTAQVRMVRAALPHLRAAPFARIVNIASTEGWGATRFASPYTAAKHGVVGLTKSLAVELGPEQITVNCVCPGPIDTAMTASISDEDKAVFAKRRTALGRYGSAEEVAHATLNFALPSASYMTGCILPVDGGLLVRNA